MSLCQPVIWSMAAMLRDSVVVVVRTRPRAIPLAMITMTKSTHGFPFVSHIWVAYGAPLGGPSGRRSSAIKIFQCYKFIRGHNRNLSILKKRKIYNGILIITGHSASNLEVIHGKSKKMLLSLSERIKAPL